MRLPTRACAPPPHALPSLDPQHGFHSTPKLFKPSRPHHATYAHCHFIAACIGPQQALVWAVTQRLHSRRHTGRDDSPCPAVSAHPPPKAPLPCSALQAGPHPSSRLGGPPEAPCSLTASCSCAWCKCVRCGCALGAWPRTDLPLASAACVSHARARTGYSWPVPQECRGGAQITPAARPP